MERYELLNKVLMPVDKVVGTGVDLLDRYGLYEPMKGKLAQGMKAALRLQFDAQYNLEVLGEENIPRQADALSRQTIDLGLMFKFWQQPQASSLFCGKVRIPGMANAAPLARLDRLHIC